MDCNKKATHRVEYLGVSNDYCKKHANAYLDDKDMKITKLQAEIKEMT